MLDIEIRLRRILETCGLDRRRVVQDLAEALKVDRHTVGKLLRNELDNPSRVMLAEVCRWLFENDVPFHLLPHGLFGLRPSRFWEAVAAPGKVRIVLSVYEQDGTQPAHDRNWLSRHDGMFAMEIVRWLSSPLFPGPQESEVEAQASIPAKTESGEFEKPAVRARSSRRTNGVRRSRPLITKPEFLVEWVGFCRSQQPSENEHLSFEALAPTFKRLKREAMDLHKKLWLAQQAKSSILIGSQRVNYLVEIRVASLFGLEPFVPPERGPCRVPFYLGYRPKDPVFPSCFGGIRHPSGEGMEAQPGIYYLVQPRPEDARAWEFLPSESEQSSAGLVLTSRDKGTGAMDVIVFGLSGIDTALTGHELLSQGDRFWPEVIQEETDQGAKKPRRKRKLLSVGVLAQGKEICAHMLSFHLARGIAIRRDGYPTAAPDKLVPIAPDILKAALSHRQAPTTF